MMGMRISSLHEVTFDHVKVPKEYVISMDGTSPLTTYRRAHRIKTAAQALGIAQGAFDQAVKHAKEREQFGKRIIQFQGIQFMLADLLTSIEAARSLVYRAALGYDAGTKEGEELSSIARLFATDVAVRTAIDSIQIHGGVGLMREYPIERMLRDAKTVQNLDESNLVQKSLIARRII
jgi:alkylation response protein AidB-like acyl-CoA dehydrogenase